VRRRGPRSLPKRCDIKRLVSASLDNVELDSIVYSDGYTADKKLSLSVYHHRRIINQVEFADGKNHINGLENFRGYVKRRLTADHGGFKRSFKLISRERSFSFNLRDTKTRYTFSGPYFVLGHNSVIIPLFFCRF